MSLFTRVVHTKCSGEEDPQCENFTQQKLLPPFKKHCPECPSKTVEVRGANPTGYVVLAFCVAMLAGGGYWLYVRMRGQVVDPLVKLAECAKAKADGKPLPEGCGTPPEPTRSEGELSEAELAKKVLAAVQQKDYAQASKACKQPSAMNSEDATLLANCGAAAMKAGEQEMARTFYRRVLRLRPMDPYTHYNVGCLEAMSGNKEEAVKSLQKAADFGLSPNLFSQDPDLKSLAGYKPFDDLVQKVKK